MEAPVTREKIAEKIANYEKFLEVFSKTVLVSLVATKFGVQVSSLSIARVREDLERFIHPEIVFCKLKNSFFKIANYVSYKINALNSLQ